MTISWKGLVGAALSLFVGVSGGGDAAVSQSLTMNGTATYVPPTGVYVYDVAVPAGANAAISGYTMTTVNSTVTLGNSDNSTISYQISVYNNSPYEYTFNGVQHIDEAYDNEGIVFALSSLKKGDPLAAYEKKTFTVTFSYADGVTSDKTLNSVLNYEFVPKAEYIPEIVVSDALGKFKEILNTPADHKTLIDQMDDTTDRANNSYMGNVVGATTKDTKVLEELFTEDGKTYLKIHIAGKETNITAMIKREDIDGKSTTGDANGNEMSIYMTADNISGSSSVQVFAAVFTKEGDGEWYQLGAMYEGTATTNNYSGSWFGTRNSFNTDRWRSSVNYYNIGTNKTIKQVITGYLNSI